MTDIKAATAKLLSDEFGVDPNLTALLFDKGVLSFKACRDLLIREEYRKRACSKERQRIKTDLAHKFCISIQLVEKILSKNC